MATTRTSALPLLGLTIWLLTLTPSVYTASHFCERQWENTIREQHPCCEFFDYVLGKEGQPAMNLEWSKPADQFNPNNCTEPCTFSRVEHATNISCCDGWKGTECDEPVCNPPCANGGSCVETETWASALPKCNCPDPYIGRACEENLNSIKSGLKYCYSGSNCQGKLVSAEAQNITSCCKVGFTGSWGSQIPSYGCASCNPNATVVVNNTLDINTCMTSGDDEYRTFDGIYYRYASQCAVGLVVSPQIQIYAVTECDPMDKCTCQKILTVILNLDVQRTYTLEGSILTFSDGATTDTVDISKRPDNVPFVVDKPGFLNVIYNNDQKTVYTMVPALGLSMRTEPDGTCMVTVKKNSVLKGSLAGACGDMDGSADDEIGLQTQNGAERVFEKYKNTNLACGKGVQKCATPEDDAKATKACQPITTVLYRCNEKLEPSSFTEKCKAYYCTSLNAAGVEAAQKAACNVLSKYQKMCTLQTGEAINWRSKTLCPKTCNQPLQYNGLITNKCPLTCGAAMQSYARSSCITQPYGGCECPSGLARINNTCVAPSACQCQGDDGRFYNNGEKVVSGDKCRECTCGKYGLWSCVESSEKCMATCDVPGGESVKTFDGKLFGIKSGCQELTLVESSDTKYNVQIKYQPAATNIDDSGDLINPSALTFNYQGQSSTIHIQKTGAIIENGFTANIYIRQIAKNVFVFDFKGLIRVIMSRDGALQLRMKTSVFAGKLRGVCGNMDRNKDNDFMSPSNSQMDGEQFLQMYSKCSEGSFKDISPVASDKVCSQMNDVALPPNSRVDVDKYVLLCNNAENVAGRCTVLKNFAMSARINFATSFSNITECTGSACASKEIDVCDSNCRDNMYPNCESEKIYSCGCQEGEYVNKDGVCVPEDQCGCSDFTRPNEVIEPDAEIVQGCNECVCKGRDLQCTESCDEVICANTQVSRSDLLENATDTSCLRQMCPNKYLVEKQCINVPASPQLCFCREGYKQTQTGSCVAKCPCYEGGRWYDDNEVLEQNCQRKICRDGVFEFESSRPEDCKGVCFVTGASMKIKQFDSTTPSDFSITGQCSYYVFKSGNDLEVIVTPLLCGSAEKNCMNMVSVKDSSLSDTITMTSSRPGTVLVGSKEYSNNVGPNIKIVNSKTYVSLFIGKYVEIHWTGALSMWIVVHKEMFNKTSGICGNFNMDASDDKMGSDNLPKETMSKLAKSWIVNQDECTSSEEQTIGDTCEHTSRQTWAEKSCSVILEGEAFSQCRKQNAEAKSYYDNCVKQACACDTGGDCECLCDAIALFAARCNELGAYSKWRHQRLCPIQCEYGSEYQACGNVCPEACGVPANNNCSCAEGCFCPPGYVRTDLDSMKEIVCIPKSECPCITENGREVLQGQATTINCQECECKDGDLVCTGDVCSNTCNDDEFRCNDGHCINEKLKCNGVADCRDGLDEFDCIGEICTGYLCRNGQCVSNTSVCDKKMDCMDNSDEALCDKECDVGEFKCSHSTFCIPQDYVCDGNMDCWYGEEEFNCTACPHNETHCNQTYCIPKNYHCDGHDDCGDGSDEIGCTYPLTTTPKKCLYKSEEINKPGNGISIESTTGFGENAFTKEGVSPAKGEQITITIYADKDTHAALNRMVFRVLNANGTIYRVIITTPEGTLLIQESPVIGDNVTIIPEIEGNKGLFEKIAITASGTIAGLSLDICYEPLVTPSETTPETTTTPALECDEGSQPLTDEYFGPSSIPTDGVFRTDENGNIRLLLNPSSNVELDVLFGITLDISRTNFAEIAIYKRDGTKFLETINTAGKSYLYYPIENGINIKSVEIKLDVDRSNPDAASAKYVGAEGCARPKNCTSGYCKGECLDQYDNLCSSPCPPLACATTPSTTISTIKTTPVTETTVTEITETTATGSTSMPTVSTSTGTATTSGTAPTTVTLCSSSMTSEEANSISSPFLGSNSANDNLHIAYIDNSDKKLQTISASPDSTLLIPSNKLTFDSKDNSLVYVIYIVPINNSFPKFGYDIKDTYDAKVDVLYLSKSQKAYIVYVHASGTLKFDAAAFGPSDFVYIPKQLNSVTVDDLQSQSIIFIGTDKPNDLKFESCREQPQGSEPTGVSESTPSPPAEETTTAGPCGVSMTPQPVDSKFNPVTTNLPSSEDIPQIGVIDNSLGKLQNIDLPNGGQVLVPVDEVSLAFNIYVHNSDT
uniref:VWFD domain-containing protein n=1 Tax=Biomphalaria glabrata TaxID=6526 RepID=A0A2C9JWJ1_BIOGL